MTWDYEGNTVEVKLEKALGKKNVLKGKESRQRKSMGNHIFGPGNGDERACPERGKLWTSGGKELGQLEMGTCGANMNPQEKRRFLRRGQQEGENKEN